MAMCVNAEMCSYVRSLFEHPSKSYESYQENGTKYLKSRKKLNEELQQQLNACAGEIFLCGIPPETQAEKIAEVAALVGEVYILRFKVHFSGASRGFAYLQYIDPNIMALALTQLPVLFATLHLHSIKVCTSRNSSKLLLCKTSNISPNAVYDTLSKLVNFSKIVGHEVSPDYFEYQIVFKCNEEAVHARREIHKSILKFGPKAIIIWDADNRGYNYNKFKPAMFKYNAIRKSLPGREQNQDELNLPQQQLVANNFQQKLLSHNTRTLVNDFRYLNIH